MSVLDTKAAATVSAITATPEGAAVDPVVLLGIVMALATDILAAYQQCKGTSPAPTPTPTQADAEGALGFAQHPGPIVRALVWTASRHRLAAANLPRSLAGTVRDKVLSQLATMNASEIAEVMTEIGE